MSNKIIDVEIARAEHAVFERKCASYIATGQKLLARIRQGSKYYGQNNTDELFPVAITCATGYCVVGGPGGQYRLCDVDLFVVFYDHLDPIQITFDG